MKRPMLGLRIGLIWGVGHASGVILVGLLGVLLRTFIEIEALSRWAEFVVGFVLIGVGIWAISQMRKVVLHRHPHEHDVSSLPPAAPSSAHAHIHVHVEGGTHDERAHHRHHARGSYLVGLIHGAAGTGHLLGVIPSLALPPLAGALYLGCYGIAAIIAMGAFGLLMGLIGNRLDPQMLRRVMLGCGLLAIGLGLFWLGAAWQALA
jgi:ABC-type nickel/cobalt efflux system permease component RcnA